MRTTKGNFLLKIGQRIWTKITGLLRSRNTNRLTIKDKAYNTGKLQKTRYITYCSQLLVA